MLHPPPKSRGAISSLMCHLPSIQNTGNLTGLSKCMVKLYLFSSLLLLLLFLWMRNLLFALKGARGKEETTPGAMVPLAPSSLLMANTLPAMADPCVTCTCLIGSVSPKQQLEKGAGSLAGCCSGSAEATRLLALLICPSAELPSDWIKWSNPSRLWSSHWSNWLGKSRLM